MRNLKRALSLAVASVMLLGMMVVGSGASYADVTSADNQEAIEVMQAVGIMTGDDQGNFNPDQQVTRGEMAVIMCSLLDLNPGGVHPFTDVPAWADSYVAAIYTNGITGGTSATTYGTDEPVTAVQAALMVMKALGYFGYQGEFGDSWILATIKQANEIDLFDGLSVHTEQPLTPSEVAQLVLNALESDVVIVREIGGMDVSTGDGTNVSVRPEYDINYVQESDQYNGVPDGRQQRAEKLYDSKLTKVTAGQETDYGMPATTWYYPTQATGDKIGTYATKQPLATWTTGIQDITDGQLYTALGNTGTLTIYMNGASTSQTVTPTKGSDTKSLAAYKGATLYAVDTDDDGVAERLCVAYPFLAQVTKVTEATDSADRKVTLKVWNDTDGSALTGVTYETEEYTKDDYVLVYVTGSMATVRGMNASTMSSNIIEVKDAGTVVGQVTSVSGTNGSAVTALTVNGTKYTVAGGSLANKGLTDSNTVATSSFGWNPTYTLLLSNGYVMGVDGDSVAADIDNIVYVTKAAYKMTNDYGEEHWYVETIALDGTIEILENYGYDDGSGDRQDDNGEYASGSAGTDIAAGFYVIDEDDGAYKFTKATDTTSQALDNATYYYGTNALNVSGGFDMKTDTTSIVIDAVDTDGDTRAYVTDTTRVLFVDGTGSKLTVSMVNGPVRQHIADNAPVLLSKDGNSYVVEAIIVNAKQVSATDEVVYVDGVKRGENADGNEYRMYSLETGEYETVTVDGTVSAGYKTYSIDADGVYTFSNVSGASGKNGDGVYSIAAVGNFSRYNNLISVSGSPAIEDLDAGDAVIINLDSTNDDALSLSDLDDATTLVGTVYVEDEVVIAIVVTSYTPGV